MLSNVRAFLSSDLQGGPARALLRILEFSTKGSWERQREGDTLKEVNMAAAIMSLSQCISIQNMATRGCSKFFLRSNRLCVCVCVFLLLFLFTLPSCRDILQTMTQPPPRAPWHVFTRKDAAKRNEIKLVETRSLSYFLLKMDPRLPLLPSPSPPVMSRRWPSAYTLVPVGGVNGDRRVFPPFLFFFFFFLSGD